MDKKIIVKNQEINYYLRPSWRARRIRITVGHKNGVVLTVPKWSSARTAEKFLWQKADWVLKMMERVKKMVIQPKPIKDRGHYLQNKQAARHLISQRVDHYNQFYGYSYKRMAIKNQTSRWGSCSKQGNLNFNYRLLFLPLELTDYVVVHELCHLKELNHSPRFWALVAKACPDYKKLRRRLREGGGMIDD